MKKTERFKQYLTQRRLLKLDIFLLLVVVLGILGYRAWSPWYDLLPQPQIELLNPYLAKADGQGNTFVIDEERSRIVKINEEEQVEYLMKSNTREADTFWYAEDLAVHPDGTVYVLDASWDETGSSVGRECILAYDAKGDYASTLLDIAYENEIVDKHRLFSLTFWENTLYYVVSEQEGFSLCSLSVDTGEEKQEVFFAYENAFNLIQDYAVDQTGSTVYALDKRGRILKGSGGEISTLYDTAEDPDYAGKATLYRLAVDGENQIYLTDIRQNKIYRFAEGQESLEVVYDEGQVLSITAETGVNGETVLGIWQDWGIAMQNLQTGEKMEGTVFAKTASYRLLESCFAGMLFLTLLAGLWLAVRLIFCISQIKISKIQKNGILAAGTAATVALVIVTQLLTQFASVYREELMSKLYILAYTVSGMMDAESLKKVRTSEDYMGEDYQTIMHTMNMGINREDPSVQEMYCNVLRYEDGQGFAIAYLDNSIGTYYPLDEEETVELAGIYDTGQVVRNDGKDDVTGSYIYVRVPVLTKNGAVAGVIEVGTTSEVITSKVDEMRSSIMITLVLVVLIVLFLFGEILSFFDLRENCKKERAREQQSMPLHLLRCAVFITFMAFNVASSFLPVYAASFVTESLGLPKGLAASLPITLNLIFVGVTSLFCAGLLRRFSFRTVAAVSACISMVGDTVLFLGHSYYFLVLGLILNGIGMGLITNSIHMFIASSSREEVKQDGFSLFNAGSLSGINCGMMLGASLAGAIGQRTVFACSATAWLLVGALFFLMGRHMSDMPREKRQKKNVGAFLTSRGVVPYLLLIQFPYVIINSFVFYYVPIYGDAMGFSENIVCLFLMLNSLCSVYLSVAVTNYMSSRLGEKSIYLSSVLSFAALLLFGWNSTVPMLIAMLLLLGVAGSFGNSVRQVYFTKLPGVEAYGEDAAMGIYNFMDNVGESAGPVLFGSIMTGASYFPGLAGFVAVSGALNGIYGLLHGIQKQRWTAER